MSLQAAQKPTLGLLGGLAGRRLGADGALMLATILGACGIAYVLVGVEILATRPGNFENTDFLALWVSGHLAHLGSAMSNYDLATLHAAQIAEGIDPRRQNPFPYPPTFLLMLQPFGALGVRAAFAAFMTLTFALYLAASTIGRGADWGFRAAAALAAPATGVALISGQSGFLTGALMIAGFRLLSVSPVLAGVMFGLLTFKPQLGVLVPIALLAAGQWRAIFAAMATVALGAIASTLAYGPEIWPACYASIREYAAGYDTVVNLMPTVYAGALMTGAPKALANGLQAAAALTVAVLVWRAFREGVSERAIAMALIGAFLVTPHAFNYDMPMTTAALASYALARFRAARALESFEAVALVGAFLLPVAVLFARDALGPVGPAVLVLLFAVVARPAAWPRSAPA